MSIDNCLHSPDGSFQSRADLLCQEFGRYFQCRWVFPGSCLTGPQCRSGPHGYLPISYDVPFSEDRNNIRLQRASRYGISCTRMTWQIVPAVFFFPTKSPDRPKSTTWVGGGRTVCRSSRRSVPWLTRATRCSIPQRRNRRGDTFVTSRILETAGHYPDWVIEYDTARISMRSSVRTAGREGHTDAADDPESSGGRYRRLADRWFS